MNRDTVVVRLRGELDRATAPALATQLCRLLGTDASWATVVIDMAETSFLDVGGLNLLLDAHRGAIARGITVCLAGCSREVLRVMQVTEVTEVLRLIPTYRTCGGSGKPEETGSTAHTVLPSSNSATPHRIDRAATTCSPRPRGARGSTGSGRGGAHR